VDSSAWAAVFVEISKGFSECPSLGKIKNNNYVFKPIKTLNNNDIQEGWPLGCASCGVSLGKLYELCEMFSEVTADVMILGGGQLAAKLV